MGEGTPLPSRRLAISRFSCHAAASRGPPALPISLTFPLFVMLSLHARNRFRPTHDIMVPALCLCDLIGTSSRLILPSYLQRGGDRDLALFAWNFMHDTLPTANAPGDPRVSCITCRRGYQIRETPGTRRCRACRSVRKPAALARRYQSSTGSLLLVVALAPLRLHPDVFEPRALPALANWQGRGLWQSVKTAISLRPSSTTSSATVQRGTRVL